MLEKLTKREKVLIYIMICVLILALGVFFVIKPAVSWKSSVDSKYEKTKLQKMEMETTISQKQTAKSEIKEYEKKIKKMQSKFLEPMTNDEIDIKITGLIEKSGMTPQSLQIGASDSGVGAFGETDETVGTDGTEQQGSETVDGSGTDMEQSPENNQEISQEPENVPETGGNVTVNSVTVSAGGGLVSFIKLLALVQEEPGIRVSSFSIQMGGVSEDVIGATSSGTFTAQIVFELYHTADL
ncbi:hypothetical protein KO465_06910 [Candidatus Micrarchaeota archaeon]|nr:hypothetical protein [Candidatus Micrarchaeota archaeon]